MDIDKDEMDKCSYYYIDYNKDKFLNTDNYILDIRELTEISEMTGNESIYKEAIEEAKKIKDKNKRDKVLKEITDKFNEEANKIAQQEFAKKILEYLNYKPEEMLKSLNAALYKLTVNPDDKNYKDFKIPKFVIKNWDTKKISQIKYEDMNKMVAVTGWIAYLESPPHIEYYEKHYYCNNCSNSIKADTKPEICPICDKKRSLTFDAANSKGEMVQKVYLMENYEDVKSSNNPGMIACFVRDGDINKYSIGTRVKVTGFVKQYTNKFERYIKIDTYQIETNDEDIKIDKNDISKIKEIAKNPLEYIHKQLAKSIVGKEYDIIKESLALSIVGGAKSQKRNKIHILLLGNPGLGKSELLRAAHYDTPKSIYVSDASGPGLTAAITDVAGSRIMAIGALGLANHSTLYLDELDKMKKEDAIDLNAAMEQMEFTKSKAGIKMRFETHTAIVAAANPRGSYFDPQKTIIEQINIPLTLLQRFDIIWVLEGKYEINAYDILKNIEAKDDEFIKKYFYYCSRIDVEIPDNIKKKIASYFSELRKKTGDIELNARTLLAMKRITEAYAKLHLRKIANEEDYSNMVKIFDKYLQYFGYSVSNIYMPPELKEKMNRILELLKQKTYSYDDLKKQSAMEEEDLKNVLSVLKREGYIYENNHRYEFIK